MLSSATTDGLTATVKYTNKEYDMTTDTKIREQIEQKALECVPSPWQKALQEMGFYFFIHFGMNTFSGHEWGSGKESPALFNPKKKIDTDQWARVAKEVGAGAIIFTAKHHEGFCLWQTNTTEHSIKNSPYQGGKGDVVRDLAASCKKYGIKLGFYLSPADRNSEYFATDKYNDYYCEQLTELLTNYGEIFCLWLDGADGGTKADGKYQDYDYERYFETARKLQPDIILANGGPDVRWVGNEDAETRDSEWSVVPACICPSVAKHYKGKVGVHAVQEAIAAKQYYRASKAIVVTNSTFTKAAKGMAKRCHVKLKERF